MPFLKPVQRHRVKSAINLQYPTLGFIKSSGNAKHKKSKLAKACCRSNISNSRNQRKITPLEVARRAILGVSIVVKGTAAHILSSTKKEYVPRINDYSGVITAEDLTNLQKEEQLSGFNWQIHGAKNIK